ncbi:hypothetical protein ES703_104515 [subsurface metagenome]
MEIVCDACDHWQKAEDCCRSSQQDRPQAGASGSNDRLPEVHPPLVEPVGVIDEDNAIVDYHSGQGDDTNTGHNDAKGQFHDGQAQKNSP